MAFEVGGQIIKGLLDAGFIGKIGAGNMTQKSPTEAVSGKQTVQIGALYSTVSADCTLVLGTNPGKWSRHIGAGADAYMHVIARYGCTRRQVNGVFDPQLLDRRQDGFDFEKTQTPAYAGRAFDAVRVGDGMAQHLIPTANADDLAPAR